MRHSRLLALLPVLAVIFAISIVSSDEAETEKKLRVSDVEVAVTGVGPVILLKVEQRTVPIFVDTVVAASIQAAVDQETLPRPMTHDLMRTVLKAFEGEVTGVTILLHEGVFYGELEVTVREEAKVFDSRSSDAIALAVRAKAPIFVTQDVLDAAGQMPEGQMM